jgi:hypothetical protein
MKSYVFNGSGFSRNEFNSHILFNFYNANYIIASTNQYIILKLFR